MTGQTIVENLVLAPMGDPLLDWVRALARFDLESANGSLALRACVFDLVDPLLDAVTAIYMLTGIKTSLIIVLYGLKADRASDRLLLLI